MDRLKANPLFSKSAFLLLALCSQQPSVMSKTSPLVDSSVARKEIAKFLTNVAFFCAYLAFMAAFYCTYEGWKLSDSIMFSLVTMTTIGYGYRVPSDDSSRLFTVFGMIIGVFLIFGGINNAVATRIKNMNRTEKLLQQEGELTETEVYRHHQRQLAITITFIIIFLFIAAGIFAGMENWTFIKGLYFAVQTAATVGYGDLDLVGHGTNIFLGFYIVVSTTLMFFAFGHFRTLHEEFVKLKEVSKFTERTQTLDKLKELDQGSGVPMDKFILAVLVQTGRLNQHTDIDPWIKKFRQIDTDNNGAIDSEEIEIFSRAEADRAAAKLQALRVITTGTDNVAWATLTDMSNSVNVFSGGFNHTSAPEEESEGVDMGPVGTTRNSGGRLITGDTHSQMHTMRTQSESRV